MNDFKQSFIMIPSNYFRDEEVQLDPYHPFQWYEKMRHQTPVYYNERADMWNVFLYQDVKRVMEDKNYFSSVLPPKRASPFNRSVIGMDQPMHTDIRSIVMHSFTPKMMKSWAPRIEEITKELLENVQDKQEFDLVQDFSYPLPVIVIAEMLGVPSSEMPKFKEWSDIVVSSPDTDDPDHLAQFLSVRTQADEELTSFFTEIVDQKRRNPHQENNIISILIQAESEDSKISIDELVAFCKLLLVAGNETTTNFISNAMYSLLEHPEAYRQVQQDLSLVPQALEETLRYRSPAQRVVRRVKEDVEIGTNLLKKDQIVISWIGSANRDETVFEHASTFDISRKVNPHLAFGQGIHFCLGAPLARLEAKISLTELLKNDKRISFHEINRPVPIKNSTTIYGLKSFPIIVT
ncbi:cytochrome P450 [Brevibacillus laterosporus]|uniref:Cytochrome P450 n=1 Tax=Brevibacillus laterosporus TaxID=1465 RepID=A0AAP3GB48_BRELA|nr:cytochrome P450 [Brevibacillus laterosporus]ATO49993.1 cytochrome P450 [Brevibacillus laterosporus DSM 25]AYB39810.1 cytochrome P450 [Brevibacillus laterosporus]MBG9803068.1 cytochrome P450 [Brevibacillus laterosporus]MBM7109801.1 Cytochrome P450(MEG) [Brevibacillus laterosporus]MCR8980492.1 cytochrome P450 [Brevibacillus laterosporus]